MNLELAEDASNADAVLENTKKVLEDTKKHLIIVQAIHKRAHADLQNELHLHGYAADDAMVKRAKKAALFDDRARKLAYKIATGHVSMRSQWIEIDDGDECVCDDCSEKSTQMNVFNQECRCDDCCEHVFFDFTLADLLDDEEDIELAADTVAFEWRVLGKKVGDLKCALCDKPPAYQFIGSKHLRCKEHYPH